jgi:hypothetical protein
LREPVGPEQLGALHPSCTRTINSNAAATFTANASGSATVGSVTLTHDTDPATTTIYSGMGGSGPATKIYVAPVLTITKTRPGDRCWRQREPRWHRAFTITVRNTATDPAAIARNVVMTDTMPAGLSWTDDKTECAVDQVTVSSVSGTVSRAPSATSTPGVGFSVTVTSSTIPSNFLQQPPSPAGSPIEIDGDLVDGAAPGKDWASLPSSVFSCGNPSRGCDIDLPTGKNDNAFGQGTKEDDEVPTVVKGSIPNNKSDLLRFYVVTERFGSTDYLYLAWSRVQEPNGTTNMDFELNQSTLLSANGITPRRTAGDLLIRYDLSQGGTVPNLGYQKWVTSGGASLCEAANATPCWGKRQQFSGNVLGAINAGTISEPIAGGTLSPRTFGEASINLTNSGIFNPNVCQNFGRAT